MTKFKKVLLIDDDSLSNFIAKLAIQHAGIAENIEVVNGAQQGLDLIFEAIEDPGKDLPDLILLDLNMPMMSGWDFLDEYKKLESQLDQKIKIVILSSSVFSKDVERAMKCKQVKEYMSKPLKIDTIKDLHKRLYLT